MLLTCAATFVWIFSPVTCATLRDVENLYQVLQNRSEYDRHIVPLIDQNQKLFVDFSLMLSASDIEFIEVENKVRIRVDVETLWRDENLHWNASDYGNLTELQIQGDWVWRPDTLIRIPQRGEGMDQILEGDSKELDIVLYDNGMVFRHTTLTVSLFCSIDTTDFPFDEQTFTFILSMQTLGSNLEYTNSSACLHNPLDDGNPRWSDLRVSNVPVRDYPDLKCTVSMRRKPLFFVINIILPVVFLGFLEVLVFLIPADAGEKLSYAVALLLSYSVFVSFVADNIPEDSDHVSDLFYYITIQFFLGAFIIFCTTLQLRLYHRDDEKDIPCFYRCIVKFVSIILCREMKGKNSKVKCSTKEVGDNQKETADPLTVPNKDPPTKYRKTSRVMRRMKTKTDLKDRPQGLVPTGNPDAEVKKLTWHSVSSATDFLLFWVFLSAQIVLNLWFFYPAYKAQ